MRVLVTGATGQLGRALVQASTAPGTVLRLQGRAAGPVVAGRVPWSILRLTQFHSFVAHIIKRGARAPFVILLPKTFLFQNPDLSDAVGRTLSALADGPGGRLPDYGGPEVLMLGEAAAIWRRARGVRKPIVNLPMFGGRAAAFRAGLNTAPAGKRGVVTFGDWLARR